MRAYRGRTREDYAASARLDRATDLRVCSKATAEVLQDIRETIDIVRHFGDDGFFADEVSWLRFEADDLAFESARELGRVARRVRRAEWPAFWSVA